MEFMPIFIDYYRLTAPQVRYVVVMIACLLFWDFFMVFCFSTDPGTYEP